MLIFYLISIMLILRPLVSMRCNRVSRPICSTALKMTNAAAFGSKEDYELFYNIINSKDASKEIVSFLINQKMEKLMMQAENEKLVMQAENEKLVTENEKLVMRVENEKLVMQAENEKLVMQVENEKLVMQMQAEVRMINAKFIDAQREINSNTPRDIIGNEPIFSFHTFILV